MFSRIALAAAHTAQVGFAWLQTATYDRPPPGLAQGRYAAQPWAIVAATALIVLCICTYFWLRRRSRLREASPPSSVSSSRRPSSRSR